MIKANKLLVSVAVSMALYGGSVYAEEADDEEDSNVIIITASKRPTSLQETPIAITVISEESIEQTKIQDIYDLQALVPTLRVTPLQRSTNTGFALRGFANGTNNTGIEPSVGIFIDGVYRSRAAAQIGDLPRLDQIEVLSGPQSTLFGKNASAGVINIRTKAPSFDLEGKVEIGVGNYNQRVVKAYVTNSLTDNVAFSLSALSSTRDGYTTSIANGLGELNDRDRTGFRGQLLWEPSDDISVRLIADMSEIDEVCCTIANFADGPVAPVMAAFAGGIALDPSTPFSYESALNFNPVNKVEDSGFSIEANVDYGSFIFTSITASRTNESSSRGDVDFSAADLLEERTRVDIDTFTQEFRLTSTGADNKFDWMVGAFIFQEDIDTDDSILFGTQARGIFDTLFGGPAALGATESFYTSLDAGSILRSGDGAVTEYTQSNDAFSIFATFDYELSDQLTATLGLSYTDDEKEITVSQINTDVFSAIDLDRDLTVFGVPITFLGQDALVAGLRGLQFLQPMLAFPNAVEDGKSSDDDITWSLRLAYEVNENVNLFATASTGFKATSWNLSRDTRPTDADDNDDGIIDIVAAGLARGDQEYGTRFAGPEESSVFELGMKTRFEQGAFNVTIFDQTIKGFQSSTFIGTGFVLANAGEQSTKGIEFDSVYRPTENITLTLAGSFLDPIYDSYQNAAVDQNGNAIHFTGRAPTGIHPRSLVAGVKYDFELASGSYAYVRADYLQESKVLVGDASPDIYREVGTVNMSAGITLLNGVNVQLWVRNLNDDEYFMSAFPTPIQAGSLSAYPNQPRTYGASVSYEF
ncbi:MAG: TonB-dependent receptor [Gammaproteobacteria bacterium]|nr:MAG: TonB-dependent receptor [Gammaproteobacteria bacterium]